MSTQGLRSPPPVITSIQPQWPPAPTSTSTEIPIPSEAGRPHSKRLGMRGWQLMSPYTDPYQPKRLQTRPKAVEHVFDPRNLVDADQLTVYKAFMRNINGEQRDVDVLASVDPGWFMHMQSNFMNLEDTHMEAYLHILRKRQLGFPNMYKQRINVLDTQFYVSS
ncbi:hypothetical protein Ddye_009346 [Dipteronia dyeriana]|uniref:Uncharacterized protein n=1 Tax=Dipteronia dyeriana TaxID=168575 RepID=A0AAD9XBE2_9ROSI|nr:hypothetical protein Ddye_009346 [Dipteronia dyeriana]